jgi:hypothetical protein
LIGNPQRKIDRFVADLALSSGKPAKRLYLRDHVGEETITAVSVRPRLQLTQRVLRLGQHGQAVARHEAEWNSIVEARLPEIADNGQRIE